MLVKISIVFLVVLAFFCFKRKNGHALGLFICIMFLLPEEIKIIRFQSLNVIRLALVIMAGYTLVWKKTEFKDFTLLKIAILLAIFLFPGIVVSEYILRNKYVFFVIKFFPNAFFAGLIFYYNFKAEDFETVKKYIYGLALFWTIYGTLEFITNQNIFIEYLIKAFPNNIFSGIGYDSTERLFSTSRMQGTCWHPIEFGGRMMLLLSVLVYFFILVEEKSKFFRFINIVAICGSLFMVLLSFSRSAWLASVIVLVFAGNVYLVNLSQTKRLVLSITILVVTYFAYGVFGAAYEEMNSFGGSSTDMRKNQMDYILHLIRDDQLFGLGKGFIVDFILKFGKSTPALGFESALMKYLTEHGFFGLVGYFLFYISVFGIAKGSYKYKMSIYGVTAAFLTYSLFTGEMHGFFIFFLILSMLYKFNEIMIDIEKNITEENEFESIKE